MSKQFSFSSLDFPSGKAFSEYAKLYGHGADVARGQGPFRAQVRAWRFDGILLFERRLNGVVHQREDRVARDRFDHLVVTLVLSGSVEGSPASGFDQAGPGEIYLTDMTRTSRTEMNDAHLLTASVSRVVFDAAFGSASGLHGQILSPPANLMLADFMRSMARHGDVATAGALSGIPRAFVDLLSTAAEDRMRASSEARRVDFLRREIVERHIEARLGDPELAVDSICAATGISRSSLYRLFHRDGGIARLIQRRRVAAVRSAIDARDRSSLMDIAQRFGFAGEDVMARTFEEEFEISPSSYRRAVAATADGATEESRRRWRGWMSELS